MFNDEDLELDGVLCGSVNKTGAGGSLTSSNSDSEEEAVIVDQIAVDMKLLTSGRAPSSTAVLAVKNGGGGGGNAVISGSIDIKKGGLSVGNITPPTPGKCGRWDGRLSPKRSKRLKDLGSAANRFEESYILTNDVLGRGAYATVVTCINRATGKEYAAKVIDKHPGHSRIRIIKEIELFHLCAGHQNIVQLIEYFEEDEKFYLIFEKMRGGVLLDHIQRRICFTEREASVVVRDIAEALKFLHDKGIAHRDLKPENVLCTSVDSVSPVKLCDLDLASKVSVLHHRINCVTTPELQSPVGSAEFMAPEVVDAFVGESLSYDKRCDLWSLGVILYIMLCGYPPFYGECDDGDCGWNQGLPCSDCQDSLFAKIQIGYFEFPDDDWSEISNNAKDLIRHLLIKDANRRYTIEEVLHHPFLVEEIPQTMLQTANYLLRNDSNRDLCENFNAIDRFKLHERLSNNGVRPAFVTAGTTPGYQQQQHWT